MEVPQEVIQRFPKGISPLEFSVTRCDWCDGHVWSIRRHRTSFVSRLSPGRIFNLDAEILTCIGCNRPWGFKKDGPVPVDPNGHGNGATA